MLSPSSMKLESFGDGPLETGPVDPIKGCFFAGKEFQGLAPDVFHYLPGLFQAKVSAANFHESQIHQEAQVPEVAVLFPDGLFTLDFGFLSQNTALFLKREHTVKS
jgi:hypothetical protein